MGLHSVMVNLEAILDLRTLSGFVGLCRALSAEANFNAKKKKR
jgi:hypothetical protein